MAEVTMWTVEETKGLWRENEPVILAALARYPDAHSLNFELDGARLGFGAVRSAGENSVTVALKHVKRPGHRREYEIVGASDG